MNDIFKRLLAAVLAAFVAGCGGSATDAVTTPPAMTPCTPGMTVACACTGLGSVGSQTCSADGRGYDECWCPVVEVDAGAADVPVPERRAMVRVTCSERLESEALTATPRFTARSATITPVARPLSVVRWSGRFGWSGRTLDGSVVGRNNTRYFSGFTMREHATGNVLMGPVDVMTGVDRRSGSVVFSKLVTLPADVSTRLDFTVDIAEREEAVRDFTHGRYALTFGGSGSEPRRMFQEGDLQWADTGETVRSDEIEYSESCFLDPDQVDFYVRPRFADITAGLGDYATSTDAVGNVRVAMLDVAFTNDGATTGTVSSFPVMVSARSNGRILVNFTVLQTRCDLTTPDGHILAYGRVETDRVTFDTLTLSVPPRTTVHAIVRCDMMFPTATAITMSTEWYEVRMGVRTGDFALRSDNGLDRITGTTQLDDNRHWATSEAVTITLRSAVPLYGGLHITPEAPVRRTVASGSTEWQRVNSYTLTAGEALTADMLAIRAVGNLACLRAVGVSGTMGGATYGLFTGLMGSRDLFAEVTLNEFRIPMGTSELALSVTTNAIDDADPSACHTGDELVVLITDGERDSYWNPAGFGDSWYVRAVSDTGRPVRAPRPGHNLTCNFVMR